MDGTREAEPMVTPPTRDEGLAKAVAELDVSLLPEVVGQESKKTRITKVTKAIEQRKREFPVFELCMQCKLACKQHKGEGVPTIQCFSFLRQKKLV